MKSQYIPGSVLDPVTCRRLHRGFSTGDAQGCGAGVEIDTTNGTGAAMRTWSLVLDT